MSKMMRMAEFRKILEEPLREGYDDPEAFKIKCQTVEREYIKRNYPNGVPALTEEEKGMMSGNTR